MNFSSKKLEQLTEAFSSLPGVGKKSALRLALHILDHPAKAEKINQSILEIPNIKTCKDCFNLSDHDICDICSTPSRKSETLCVVEGIRDVMAIEDTNQFNGKYHVLGGVISPLDGVGPSDLNIEALFTRIKEKDVKEIIMAISPTIEGETTIYYISKKLKPLGTKITVIARGVSFGGELEYADELTLGRSIMSRLPYYDKEEQSAGL